LSVYSILLLHADTSKKLKIKNFKILNATTKWLNITSFNGTAAYMYCRKTSMNIQNSIQWSTDVCCDMC